MKGLKVDWSRDQDISVDEVKAIKVLHHFTDEQANELIDLIKLFCQSVYAIHISEINGEIDLEEKIIQLNPETKIAA